MSKRTVKQLAKIIKWMGNKHPVPPVFMRRVLNDALLQEIKDEVLLLNKNTAGRKIITLQEDLHRDSRYVSWQPYLAVFLAYAYSVLDVGSDALKWAKRIHTYSCLWTSDWDKALSHWFLGTVYCQNNLFAEASIELTTAKEILERHAGNANNAGKYADAKESNNAIKLIEIITAVLPPRIPQPSLAASAPPGYIPPAQPNPAEGQDEKNQKDGTLPMNINVLNINIPIDVRPTNNVDNKFDNSVNNKFDLDADISSSFWLEPSLPEAGRSSLLGQEIPPQNVVEIKDLVGYLSYIITPSFPLYGSASAGPNGCPVLNEPDYLAVIDETSLIRFEDQEYRIYSEKKGDGQISISKSDFLTSIFPPQISERFGLKGKRYGWLKVVGNSMNKADPIPIESGDYVLFYRNDNPAVCLDKIVVATLPGSAPNAPRLVIKKLKKAKEKLPKTSNGKVAIQPVEKFYLHSDSLLDIDPDTGDDYKSDMELDEDHHIVGVVVAVASVKQKQTT